MAKHKERRREMASDPPSAPRVAPSSSAAPWFWAAATAVALIVGFIVYAPAADGPLVLDDLYQYFGRPEAGRMGFTSWIASVRPLLNATFWVNYQLSGTNTASYHHMNVLLHVLTSIVVLAVMRLLWRRAGGQGEWAPAVAAAVFLLHPLQVESVAYISSRSESLSVLFAFAALALQLSASEAALSIRRIAAMLVLLGMAVLTKEHTAAMPAVFLLTDYFWRGGWPAVRANWKLHASMAAAGAAGLAFVARTLSLANSAGFGLKDITPAAYLFTQFRMFWRYVRMLVLPVGLNVDPDLPLSRTLADPWALAGLAGIVAVLAAAWMLRKKAPLASFGIVIFILLLAPTSSFIPILDVFAERRVYLPFLGICCLILEAFRRWRIPAAVTAAVLAVFAYGSFQRSAVWASETALWTDSVAGSPAKYRPRFQLAYAHYRAGQCAEASKEFATASKLEPKGAKRDITLYVDWALALDCLGDGAGAVARIREAALVEDSAPVLATEAMLLAKQNQLEPALAALDQAEKRDPSFAMTHVYRGNVYRLQNRPSEAQAEYQRALALDPTNTAAVQALAALRGR